MAAGSIIIDLLMRTGSFETDTKRAEKRLRELETQATKVGAAIGVAFAAAAAATTLLVKSSIDAADAASKQAQAAGLSVEAFTALAYAADLAGLEQEEFTAAMVKLSRTAADADAGVKASAEAFTRLGVSVRDSTGQLKTGDVLLEDLAEAFSKMPEGINKTALATDVFGKSGARLLPLLNAGKAGIQELKSEAQALGVVFSTETAIAAEQFNDNLSRLSKLAKGFGNDLAAGLLPYLVDTTNLLVQLGKESRNAGDGMSVAETIADILAKTVKFLALEVAQAEFVFVRLGSEMAGFAAKATFVFEALRTPPGELIDVLKNLPAKFRAISQAVDEDIGRAGKQLDSFTQRVAAIGNTSKLGAQLGLNSPLLNPSNQTFTPPPRSSSGGSKTPKVSEAERYLESLQKQLQGTKDLTVAETVLADIQSGRLGKVTEGQKSAIVAVAEQIDAAKRMQDQLKAEDQQLKDLKASQDALREAGKAVYESTRTPAEKLSIELDRLNGLLQQGAINWDTYSRAVFAAQEAFDETSKAQKKVSTELDEFAKNAAENLQRSFGDVLVEAMNGNFKNIGDGFKKMLDRMVAEALAAQIVRGLFGDQGKGGGLFGNVLGTIGSAFGFSGALASGGDVLPNRSYLVGENGPERFVPRTAGTVLPSTKTEAARGRGEFQQVNNFTVQGKITRETEMQLAGMVGRRAQTAFARNG